MSARDWAVSFSGRGDRLPLARAGRWLLVVAPGGGASLPLSCPPALSPARRANDRALTTLMASCTDGGATDSVAALPATLAAALPGGIDAGATEGGATDAGATLPAVECRESGTAMRVAATCCSFCALASFSINSFRSFTSAWSASCCIFMCCCCFVTCSRSACSVVMAAFSCTPTKHARCERRCLESWQRCTNLHQRHSCLLPVLVER